MLIENWKLHPWLLRQLTPGPKHYKNLFSEAQNAFESLLNSYREQNRLLQHENNQLKIHVFENESKSVFELEQLFQAQKKDLYDFNF